MNQHSGKVTFEHMFAEVTVCVGSSPESIELVDSKLINAVCDLSGNKVPNAAVGAACMSGICHARRLFNLKNVRIEVVETTGRIDRSEMDGVAIAAVIAVANATNKKNCINGNLLGKWRST